MKISIAADHAGYDLKERIKDFLRQEGYEIVDTGAHSYDPMDDYPDFAEPAAQMVADGEVDRGIVICDTGIGVDIVANKVAGVRSALVHTEELAHRAREHNDSNVIALGAMVTDENAARRIVKIWLDTPFSQADRHRRRIHEIEEIEEATKCLK